MRPLKEIYISMICCGFVIASQSLLRWEIKTSTVFYGQNVTLSCNGNGCMPTSIRKWIGGPTYDVLCFDDYSSNPSKYQLMYNNTKSSFDLMINSFNFTDTNCAYTCACGFFQDTHILQLDDIDFVYPPTTEHTATIQKVGKLYINMSIKVYPLPNCTIVYKNIVIPVDTKFFDVQSQVGIPLYLINLRYILNVGYQYCGENLTLSCKVRSFEYLMLQQRLELCKDHPDTKRSYYLWLILGLIPGCVIVVFVIYRNCASQRSLPEITIVNEEPLKSAFQSSPLLSS